MVIFSIGLLASPQAFADHDEITIETATGSSSPGCEPNCFLPSVVTLSKADTEVTFAILTQQLIQQHLAHHLMDQVDIGIVV